MRPETVRKPAAAPDLDAEQEVDLASYGRRIAAGWWLLVLGLVVGAVIGYAISAAGGTVFRSVATVYLGQPLSPSGNAQVQSLATNPSTVNQIVRSTAVVNEVAGEVGVRPGRLRSGISTRAVSGSVARLGQTPLVEIAVRGPWREQSAQAANLLAQRVIDETSGYVDVKVTTLEDQLEGQNQALARIDRRVEAVQAALDEPGLSPVERLVVLGQLDVSEQRRGQLLEQRATTQQLLTLAQDVERGSVVTEAAPVRVAARSRTSSVVVGALLGLMVGALAALAWPAVARKLRRG
jgi:capsular polysaccharide biosynthesis protein